MTTIESTDLDLAELGRLGAEVGSDNRHVDVELPDAVLPDVPGPLVYRRFRDDGVSEQDLRELVAHRAGQAPGARSRLDEVARRPVRVVVGGSTPGVLLAAVPEPFRQAVRLPGGTRCVVPRAIGQTTLVAGRAARLGLPTLDTPARVGVGRALAEAVDAVHAAGVGAGRLDGEQVLFRVRPDSAVLLGGAADPAPDGPAADRRALALLLLRLLASGPDAWATQDPARASETVGRPGVALFTTALRAPEDSRPEARRWVELLRELPGGEDRPAVLDEAVLDRTLVPPGDPITVTWSARWADEVWVQAPGQAPLRADDPGQGTAVVVPRGSGPITMRLVNRAGDGEWTVGRVVVLDPPRLGDLPVPVPRMDLPMVRLPELPSSVAALPDLPIEASPAQWGTAPAVWWDPPPAPTPLPDPAPEVCDPPGFDAGATSFPIDIVSIMSAAHPPTRRFTRKRPWKR